VRLVATWATAPHALGSVAGGTPASSWLVNLTVRNVVHLTVGGRAIRLRLTNRLGKRPVTFDALVSRDWQLATTAEQIRSTGERNLRPAVTFLLHDGPVDSPAGAAVIAAFPWIIADARRHGFCFGVLDRRGEVVAARHVATGTPVPSVRNPVPYLALSDASVPPRSPT